MGIGNVATVTPLAAVVLTAVAAVPAVAPPPVGFALPSCAVDIGLAPPFSSSVPPGVFFHGSGVENTAPFLVASVPASSAAVLVQAVPVACVLGPFAPVSGVGEFALLPAGSASVAPPRAVSSLVSQVEKNVLSPFSRRAAGTEYERCAGSKVLMAVAVVALHINCGTDALLGNLVTAQNFGVPADVADVHTACEEPTIFCY